MMRIYGYQQSDWDKAKREMRQVLIKVAQEGEPISYSDLSREVQTIRFDPESTVLSNMLSEISREEDSEGRGMLSAFVVHKEKDHLPGDGFFELAHKLGRDVSVKLDCWVEEINRVYACWGKPPKNQKL